MASGIAPYMLQVNVYLVVSWTNVFLNKRPFSRTGRCTNLLKIGGEREEESGGGFLRAFPFLFWRLSIAALRSRDPGDGVGG